MKATKEIFQDQIEQLIVEEYFNINHYIPFLIDIYYIKLSIIIEAEESEMWFLDTTNRNGESIVERGGNIKAFKVIVNDVEISHYDLPEFYNTFRKREYFPNWFDKGTKGPNQIVTFLKMSRRERLSDYNLMILSNKLGLLDGSELTIAGKSLIGIQNRR